MKREEKTHFQKVNNIISLIIAFIYIYRKSKRISQIKTL